MTQDTYKKTICVVGYTTTVRPPTSVTEKYKNLSMIAYGFPRPASGYEYDHLVSLELGGSSAQANLWPQPYDATGLSKKKDTVEGHLKDAVCSNKVQLAAAQEAIASDWTTAEARLGITG